MKPCPFCGKKIDPDDFIYGVRYNYEAHLWIFNHTCSFDPKREPKIDVAISLYGITKEEVIERWNSRAEDQTSESL